MTSTVPLVFTLAKPNAPGWSQAMARPIWVVGLCAAWCGTCREFQDTFTTLAAAWTDAVFIWTDVEDDAQWVGDLDVDDFPTLAIFVNGKPVHFGTTLPHQGVVDRLIKAVARETSTAEFNGNEAPLRKLADDLRALAV